MHGCYSGVIHNEHTVNLHQLVNNKAAFSHTMEYFPARKKYGRPMPFVTWMNYRHNAKGKKYNTKENALWDLLSVKF